MIERKQSFLERLTGTKSVDPAHEREEEQAYRRTEQEEEEYAPVDVQDEEEDEEDGEDSEPGIAVDIYESDNELVIQGMIAGVTPENLHISITRDRVVIRGRRNEPQGIPDEHYIARELYWGPFSRTIDLPYEIDTDGAEAIEKYGLLIIRLPKVDTGRTAELKVKSIQ